MTPKRKGNRVVLTTERGRGNVRRLRERGVQKNSITGKAQWKESGDSARGIIGFS